MTPNVPLSGLYPVRLRNCCYHQFWRQHFFFTNCILLIPLQSCKMQCIMLQDLSAQRAPCVNPCLVAQGKNSNLPRLALHIFRVWQSRGHRRGSGCLDLGAYTSSLPKLESSTAKLVRSSIPSAMTTDVRSSAAETCQVFLGLDPQRNRKGLGVSQRPLFRIYRGARFENMRGLPPGLQGTHIV